MELNEIATLAGKGGLFKIIKPTRTGVILESLDDKKSKLVANSHHRISVLEEISIYTTTQDGTVPLAEVFYKIKSEFDDDPGLEKDADNEEYRSFIKHIVPDFDEDRVYTSDVKKLISWYKIIYQYAPEVLEESNGENSENTDKEDS